MTALFEAVERMLEGFYAEDPHAILGGAEQPLARADRPKARTVELEAPLRHPKQGHHKEMRSDWRESGEVQLIQRARRGGHEGRPTCQ